MSATRRGVVAGIIAAAAVAIFFLIVDLLAGEALRTPRLMGGLLTGTAPSDVGAGAIGVFALAHFVLFVVAGTALAWLFDRFRVRPLLLLGVVLGVIFFDLVFYAGLLLRGVDVLEALGWPAFLAGNIIGGLALMGWLARTAPERAPGWRELFARHQLIREGLVAGLIGGMAVALWFLVLDLLFREVFFTPAALGSAAFEGARGVAEVRITAANVLGYTLIHFAAFFAVGLIAAAIAKQAEQNGAVILGAVLLFVTFETLFLGLTAIAATWLLDALNPWTILLANLIAAAAMGAYLWRRHADVAANLLGDHEAEDFGGSRTVGVGG